MKNVDECQKEFFAYFNALETRGAGGPNCVGTICPERPINWEPFVQGDQKSGDQMCSGPNESQPSHADMSILLSWFFLSNDFKTLPLTLHATMPTFVAPWQT